MIMPHNGPAPRHYRVGPVLFKDQDSYESYR